MSRKPRDYQAEIVGLLQDQGILPIPRTATAMAAQSLLSGRQIYNPYEPERSTPTFRSILAKEDGRVIRQVVEKVQP